MTKKNTAKVDIVKSIAGVSFATLAAIGGSTGNPLIAGISAIPSAGLASSEIIGDQLQIMKPKLQREKYLEIPLPAWWMHDTRTWQNLCAEIGNHLPQILEIMQERMQQEQRVLTRDIVRQIFIDALIAQHLTWEHDTEQKRCVGEFVSTPILQKLDEVLQPVIGQLQVERSLIDKRRTAQNTEQTVHVLEKIHEQLSDVSTPHPLSVEEIAITRKQYCDTLHQRWRMLDFKGIMHIDMNRPISIPLSEVFIFPDVLIGIPEHETLEREGEHLFYRNHPQQKIKRFIPQREALQAVLAKHHRLVLLGDPGSGKSTLLRYFLLQLAQGSNTFATAFPQMADAAAAVPLYMPLATYAEALLSNAPGMRSLEDFLPTFLRDNYLGAYIDFIWSQLQHGNLFFLFDGLDEIPDTALRMNVVRHIEMFTQTYAANRFIVTSRIVGYKAAPLSSEYQPYTLADFDDEQVRAFAQKWCPAYECWVQGVRESQYLADTATKEAEKLFSATQSKPGVRRLAVNPLLLTILALIQRQGIELPSHRVELFELCVLTLIDTWVKARGQSTPFSKNDIIKILRPLAFWMHEHPAVGAIPEEELHEQIVRQLVGRTINEYEATKMAEQFLQTVRGKTGILVERGKERYGFLHLTFEEYFAARELEKRKDKQAFIRTHLHDPRWREVILLMVGAIGILQSNEEEVTDLVQDTIAKAGSPFEESLHRDLLFAGLCIADDVGVTVACENEIIERVMYLYITSPYDKQRDTISSVLAEWSGTRIAEKVIHLIFPLLQQWGTPIDPRQTFSAISLFENMLAQQMERLVTRYQEAMTKHLRFLVTILLARLDILDGINWIENLAGIVSEDDVKARMVSVLEQCTDRQRCITDALLIALFDPDHHVRWDAIVALGQLGATQPRVIDALLITVSDPYYKVREVALNVLGQSGEAGIHVIDAILEVLLDSFGRRGPAVRALGQLGEGQARVMNALLSALTDVDDRAMRQAAATALASFGKGQPHVVDALLLALSDEDSDVREAAANSLGQLCERKKCDVIEILSATISDPDANTIELAANALGRLSSNPAYVTDTLLLLFPDADIAREAAANVLGLFSVSQSGIIDALLTALAESSSWQVKREAVRALRRFDERQPRIIDALLTALAESSSWQVKREVVRALGQLSDGEPSVIDALLNTLSDSSWTVRRETIRTLQHLGRKEPGLIEALLTMVSDQLITRVAIRALGQLSKGEPKVVDALLISLTDHDEYKREEAIQALGHLVKRQPKIVGQLVTVLQNSDIASNATEAYRERLSTAFMERVLGVLRSISGDEPFIIDTLFSLLSDSNSHLRIEAARTLGQLGKKEPSITDRLLSLLSDSDRWVRQAVTWAFEQLGDDQPQVVDALLLALSDSDRNVRWASAVALRQCNKGQPQVLEALLRAISDKDSMVRAEAAFTLGRLGEAEPRVIDALLQAFSDPRSGQVRQRAALAVQFLTDGEMRVNEALLQLLFGTSALARREAASAIGRRWHGQKNIIDTLLARCTSPDMPARVSAAQGFIAIQNKQREITDALLPQLADSSWLVREATAEALALRRLDGEQPNVVTSLLLALSDPFPQVRAEAARALQVPEVENSHIIEALIRATFDSDWFVRESAASALSTAQDQIEIIGERLEQLLQQYEHIAQRDLRRYNPIFNALEEIAKKM